jgi:hypothetical protein
MAFHFPFPALGHVHPGAGSGKRRHKLQSSAESTEREFQRNFRKKQALMKHLVLACITLLGTTVASTAGTISLVTSRSALGANDSLSWSVLGPPLPGTIVPDPFTGTSLGGLAITGSSAFGFGIGEQCPASVSPCWPANFAPGDSVLFTFFSSTTSQGPTTLTFGAPIFGVGFQIGVNGLPGPTLFTATIEAFDGSTLLGSFSENGVTNMNEDNSAIFIGVKSSIGDITSVAYNIPTFPMGDVINQLSLAASPTPTPEPATLLLLSSGLSGLSFARRGRRKAADR